LNIDLIIFIILISYNISFTPPHLDYRIWKPHKNKITNKQVSKKHVCNNVQRRAHASRPTIWRDDKIFKVNIDNGTNGCTLLFISTIFGCCIMLFAFATFGHSNYGRPHLEF
jgi:hypothetical protein